MSCFRSHGRDSPPARTQDQRCCRSAIGRCTIGLRSEEQGATSEAGETHGICLVSGVMDEIARLHEPKIKGVAGAQSAGALLVSDRKSKGQLRRPVRRTEYVLFPESWTR